MKRLRSYRKDQKTRDKHAEVSLSLKDFIYPYFVVEGKRARKEIPTLGGVFHLSIDKLLEDLKETVSLGIDKILLFGVVEDKMKDKNASSAYEDENLVERAVRDIKKRFPAVTVITDVCLCAYTDHGHCGLVKGKEVLNDETLPLLARMALTHARAGADFVAPSGMMDGQVGAIRKHLDKNGFRSTKILSYSAKYASNLYGPFRDVFESSPSFGDRKSYQMDYRTVSQGIEEVKADLKEGADWVMVKPAHTYLDMIQRIRSEFPKITLAAYHVSGEYMLIKAAAEAGLIDEEQGMMEVLHAVKRAGSDFIISYYAKDFAGKAGKNARA